MEKSYSWEEMANLTHATQVTEFGFCSCEDNGENPNPYEDCPTKTNTYVYLRGEVVEIEATSEIEAMELLGNGEFKEVETETLLLEKPCKSCSDPAAPGWHVDQDAGITFGGLKKAQNKVMEEIAQYIAHIYFTKSSEVFNDLMEDIADETFNAAKFGGYSENCEWLARANGGN